MSLFALFLLVINGLNLFYLLTLNTSYLLMSLLSLKALRKYTRRLKSFSVEQMLATAGAPPISLLVPAYNEEATCVESVRALLNLQYPDFEMLVVNDGSKDETLQRLIAAYDMHMSPRMPVADLPTKAVRGVYRSQRFPELWLIDKANGGKADALNTGINFCQSPLFCAIDADSLLEPDSLLRVVRPFLEEADTIAAGGIIRIVNGCTVANGVVTQVRLPQSLLARFQVLEYLRAFLAGRMGWGALGSTFIISGAFGLFKRSRVVDVGGYDVNTVGEDMELIVRLHRDSIEKKIPYHMAFVPDPVAWTECPEDLKILASQRNRWQRGLMDALYKHRVMFFNPRYGRLGMVTYPYFFILEMLGPILEVLGYVTIILTWATGMLSQTFLVAFFLVAFIYGGIISIFSVALEELTFRRYQNIRDLFRLMITGFFESFGYRQLLTWWRFKGMYQRLTSRQQHQWGQMTRKGFQNQALAQETTRPNQ